MRGYKLPPRQAQVLKYIAQKGPRIYYRLTKEMDHIPPGTLHNALVELEKKQLLYIEKKGKAPRPGETIKEYHLTVLGLILIVDHVKLKKRRPIIERWPDLIPLVTGKWGLFVKGGVEDRALRMFAKATSSVIIYVFYNHPDRFKYHVGLFSHRFYDTEILHDTELLYGLEAMSDTWDEILRWTRVCAEDPEVHDYLIEKMNETITRNDLMNLQAKGMLKMLQGKDEKRKKPRPWKR